MASKASLLLVFSLLFATCFARHQQQQQNQCQLQNIEALEPNDVIKAEAGVTEVWDRNDQQFQCAGAEFIRHRIQPGGLLLPSYVNTPVLAYVERGRGIQGVILSGCPETFEYSPEQQFSGQSGRGGQQFPGQSGREGQQFPGQSGRGGQQFPGQSGREGQQFPGQSGREGQQFPGQSGRGGQQFPGQSGRGGQQFPGQSGRGGQQFQDRHQKVENLIEGDVVAIPTGAAHWLHNNGNDELVVVVFFDTQNRDNQLDEHHRRFFLAGNPQVQSQQGRPRQREQTQRRHGDRQLQPYQIAGNILNGFDVEFLAEAFRVDPETAQKLQGQNDQRGHIVNVGQDLQVIRPRQQQYQQQPQQSRRGSWGPGSGGSNGVEETICSLKFKENIDNPSHADFVNPQAGRISNLNSFKFPLLEHLQLNVERGELRPNAIQSPHWTINAHNLLYVTDGTLRVQIVNNEGNSVFDNELREGQVVVIPQTFAVIKRAGEQGSRWVSFKTNDNAMIANLAGRVSAISGMPVDVVANAYQLSREEAQRLKFSQRETVLLAPSFSRGQGRASA